MEYPQPCRGGPRQLRRHQQQQCNLVPIENCSAMQRMVPHPSASANIFKAIVSLTGGGRVRCPSRQPSETRQLSSVIASRWPFYV